ncbi:MAG: PadR family transcriptional regulator [Candidatus Woesearchaeota archaeon]
MNAQFKRGIIELCVLKIINDKERSTFEVIETLGEKIDVNKNTIYPILRRLTKQNYFETYTESSTVGAPRKIYKITPYGFKKLESFQKEWKHFLNNVLEILGGREDD